MKTEFKAGKQVYCLVRGFGKCISIDSRGVVVRFPQETAFYHLDGKASAHHPNQILFTAKPKFAGFEEPPFVDLKKGDVVLVEIIHGKGLTEKLTVETVDSRYIHTDQGKCMDKAYIAAIYPAKPIWKL